MPAEGANKHILTATLPVLLSCRMQGQQPERDVKLLAHHALHVSTLAQPSAHLVTLPCQMMQRPILSRMTSCWLS